MRRTLSWIAFLMVGLLVLGACVAPTPVTDAPGAPAPAAGPKTLTIAAGTDVENLDVHRVTASPSFSVLEHIYETLFYMNTEGQLEPLLAESLEPGEEENTFILKLRQGVNFSDGTPFNAEAVKMNLDYVLNPDNGSAFRFLISRIQEVEVVDDHTVKLILDSEFAPLAAHLSHGALAIVAPSEMEQGADFMANNAIGTGPYMLERWDRAESVSLVRNPNYWGDAPAIDRVVFKVVQEDGARLVEVEAGTVDVAVRVPPAEAARIDANPNVDVITTPGLRTIYIFFNVTKEPFDDVRVRQALNYAVDVEGIVNQLFDGAARVSDAPFAPPIFGYKPNEPYARDVERARALLDEAGVAEGTTLTLYHPTGRYIQDALVADAVRAQLREVGLEVELRTLEWPQYVPFVRAPAEENQVQFAMLGWGTPTMDADYALYALFHSSEHPPGFNGAFYSNPEVDRLLDEARTTTDVDTRRDLYAQALDIIWEEAPWLFLYSEVQLTAIRSNVEGFVVHPNERLIATGADIK
ncbi:MAG: glutathione ABC transporter substrate-binding protein [Chloroflexota bacterium]|nr:glutathione ABC transporter substrate-binding protein [Caldilinea sp.]GIK74033.1 MAG: glutathione ABC transporter substrate-binding protein [Chloroflexota bacterium]